MPWLPLTRITSFLPHFIGKKSILESVLSQTFLPLGVKRFLSTTSNNMQKTVMLSSSSFRMITVVIRASSKIAGILYTKLEQSTLLATTMPYIIRSGLTRQFTTTSKREMKLVQFIYNADPSYVRVGFMTSHGVTDVNILDPSLPNDMLTIIREGLIYRIFEMYCQQPCYGCIPCSCITLKAPINGVDKILCVGHNYRDHCSMHNIKIPDVPMIFSKFSSSIIGPTDPIRIRTEVTKKVDWEVELCLVIGHTVSCVPAEEAMSYVIGYTVAQDLTARDWTAKEKNLGQLLLGKSMDTFCPIGPWITTIDEIGDINNLHIQCCLNGCVKQDSRTDQMIFKCPLLIERISSVMTLYPGDLILTGTPAGVGQYSKPPEFLQPGDVLTSAMENVGVMSNHVLQFT